MGLFGSKPAEAEKPAAPVPEPTFEQAFKALAGQKTPGDNAELSSRMMQMILEYAVKQGASDIHFDPLGETVLVRFRVDGQLIDQASFLREQFAITPRLRVMSGFPAKAATSYTPEDGRFQMFLSGSPIQFRASAFPTTHGEKLVLRVLDSGQTALSLDNLGFAPAVLEKLKAAIASPNGIFFVAGLTGSGKTTTLCSILKAINKPNLNIMTLEDPVEYDLPRVIHAQINPKAGFTFAEGLRCLLRQDPNVIMVGEVRDLETAEIALRAAMTGHTIFSTLHATTATGVADRLLSMGIEPYMISSALIGALSQRLVRRVCARCAEPAPLDVARAAAFIHDLDPKTGQSVKEAFEKPGNKFQLGKGCSECKMTGYKGRVGLFELLVMDEPMRELIASKPKDLLELRKRAVASGMRTLLDDGVEKLCSGLTTFDELSRAVKTS